MRRGGGQAGWLASGRDSAAVPARRSGAGLETGWPAATGETLRENTYLQRYTAQPKVPIEVQNNASVIAGKSFENETRIAASLAVHIF